MTEIIPKIVYLAEISWVVDINQKEIFRSIVESINIEDSEQIKQVAIDKFQKALIQVKQEKIVALAEADKDLHIIISDGTKKSFSHPILIKNSTLASSFMNVTFRPVMKAAEWIFELNPVGAEILFVDSNFNYYEEGKYQLNSF